MRSKARVWKPALALLPLGLLALAGLAMPASARDKEPPPYFTLTVLHNNDGESRLISSAASEDFGGVARFKTLLDMLRKEALEGPKTNGNGHSNGNSSNRNAPLTASDYADILRGNRDRDEAIEEVRRAAEKSGSSSSNSNRDDDKTKRGVVMLSSGDNFLAGPFFKASQEKGPIFYDTIAMALMGYDAAAIGNHEFDFGPELLADFICGFMTNSSVDLRGDRYIRFLERGVPVSNCAKGKAPFPFVTANLDFRNEPDLNPLVKAEAIVKSHVVETGGEKVGIVGATTPQISYISSPGEVIIDPDFAAAIQKQVDALTKKKINKIILISHLQSLTEDLALAPMLKNVDIMIAGGGDNLLAEPGTPLVPGDVIDPDYPMYPVVANGADGAPIQIITTAGEYKYIGRLVAEFDRSGRVTRIDPISGPVRVAGGNEPDAVAEDKTMLRLVTEPVAEFVADLAATVIAETEVDLDSRNPDPIRLRESNMGNLVADAWLWQATELAPSFGVTAPKVALQNGGGIRNNEVIPAGSDITLLDTFEIAPFANFVSIVKDISPAEFKALMENAVRSLPSANGRFGHIAGFKIVYDVTGTAQSYNLDNSISVPGTRIKCIELDDGTEIVNAAGPVTGAPSVNMATIDFTARGGDQYPFPFVSAQSDVINLGIGYQEGLENYIVDGLGRVITAADYPAGGEGRITEGTGCP